MNKKDILDAWITMRKTNHTIPCEILDFMKESAIKRIEGDSEHLRNRKG